jgi:hypothetical protein
MRRIAAGLAGLGLIGGVGAVTHDDNGSAKVTITDHGSKRTVILPTEVGGKRFSCPAGTTDKLSTVDELLGRIQLTLEDVRRDEKAIEDRYPERTAPPKAIVSEYKALARRDDRLVARFNRATKDHNAVIDSDCSE